MECDRQSAEFASTDSKIHPLLKCRFLIFEMTAIDLELDITGNKTLHGFTGLIRAVAGVYTHAWDTPAHLLHIKTILVAF